MGAPGEHRGSEVGRRGALWGAVVVAVATYLPFLLHWNVIGSSDFDQFATFNRIALWWHELGDPSVTWNPFLCGGATLVGNPQIPLLHPNLLVYAVFGPVNGLGAAFVPWVLLGYFSMRALARQVELRPDIATAVAVAWTVNGFFVAHIGSMHASFFAFWALPTLAWMHGRYARTGSERVLAAYPFVLGVLALYNFQFIAYGIPFIALHAVLEVLHVSPRPRAAGRLLAVAVAVAVGLAMTGVSLIPALAWNRDYPRFMAPQFVHPLDLVQMVVLPVAIFDFPRDHRAHEYMLTLGPGLVALAVVGAAKGGLRASALRPILIITAVAFATAVGTFRGMGLPAIGPFDLLRGYAPGYQAVRVPARFLVHGLLGVLLLAGFGWQAWGPPARPRRVLIWALAVAPLVGLAFGYYQWKLYRKTEGHERPMGASLADDFRWAPLGSRRQGYGVLRPNVGILDCYDALEIPQASELRAAHGMVLESDVPVSLERLSWGELVIRAATPAPEGAMVHLNFNHHRHWTLVERPSEASIVSEEREPLALRFSAGGSVAHLRYVDPSWTFGVNTSVAALLTAAGSGCWLLWRRRRKDEVRP